MLIKPNFPKKAKSIRRSIRRKCARTGLSRTRADTAPSANSPTETSRWSKSKIRLFWTTSTNLSSAKDSFQMASAFTVTGVFSAMKIAPWTNSQKHGGAKITSKRSKSWNSTTCNKKTKFRATVTLAQGLEFSNKFQRKRNQTVKLRIWKRVWRSTYPRRQQNRSALTWKKASASHQAVSSHSAPCRRLLRRTRRWVTLWMWNQRCPRAEAAPTLHILPKEMDRKIMRDKQFGRLFRFYSAMIHCSRKPSPDFALRTDFQSWNPHNFRRLLRQRRLKSRLCELSANYLWRDW